MIVREAIVADPRVLDGEATVQDAAELLMRPNVRSALVVHDGRLLGAVTMETVVAAVARGLDLREVRARDLDLDEVATIGPDVPLDEALHLMAEGAHERLAVVEDGRLLGVLPRETVVRRIAGDEDQQQV